MVHIVYPWPKTRQLPFAIAQTRAKIFLAPFSWLENWDQNRKWAVNTRSEYQEKSHLGDIILLFSHLPWILRVCQLIGFSSHENVFSLMNSIFWFLFKIFLLLTFSKCFYSKIRALSYTGKYKIDKVEGFLRMSSTQWTTWSSCSVILLWEVAYYYY